MAKKSMPVEKLSASTVPQDTIARNTKEDEARERKYKASSALDDIERAEKHKSDKALMKDVKQVAREKLKHLKKVAKC